jgi:uncharacterized phage protein (TIGR01671 family)
MNTAKFRGQILDGPRKGEWVYGYYANILGDHLIIDNSGIQYIVDPKTVGQYIDQEDTDDVPIYEGDILQYLARYPTDLQKKQPSKKYLRTSNGVTWSKTWSSFMLDTTYEKDEIFAGFGESKNWKVIGTIHDNPDLLTQ